MITYLKNQDSRIKVDSETKDLVLITKREGSYMVRFDKNNVKLFAEVTVVKTAEGFFVEATEEDFNEFKDLVTAEFNNL